IIAALIIGGAILISGGIGGRSVAGTTTTATTDTTAPTQAGAVTVTQDQIQALFTNDNIYFGDPSSQLLFVEVSDPSCPYCHIAGGKNGELNSSAGGQFTLVADGGSYVAPVVEMKKLVDEGKAAFVWIYSNGHGNGEIATQALYCAHDQGKFWEAHDLEMSSAGYDLINNTVKNSTDQIDTMADFLASVLDVNQLKDCMKSGKYAGRISQDIALASSIGVSGTPGFFVNTTNFAGAYSFTDMESVVSQYL
ncbi:DsbA family protein, partial [Candidatus Dojkabacteria bacterium]|nr:DsbA family protein [Candidatus Dojkabacteria bacterium]